MGPADITILSIILCAALLAVPVFISVKYRLKILKSMSISVSRMIIQLGLIGIFLKYIFQINNTFLNIGWFFLMILTATFSIVKSSRLKIKNFFISVFIPVAAVNTAILLYMDAVVIRGADIFDARYVIAIGGMILGNSLRGNIIGLKNFYSRVKQDNQTYLYKLSCGASVAEAVTPYIKESMSLVLEPMLATMAITGIVSLPGMMTGQILGGSSPLLAIKYQIAIMIAIFTSMTSSIIMTIFFTIRVSFDKMGILKNNIFK